MSTELKVPLSGNFSVELEVSTFKNTNNGIIDTDLARLIANHCSVLSDANSEVSLISASQKVIDIISGSKLFEAKEFTTANGTTFAGKLYNRPNVHINVAASETIPGLRLISKRGIVTYILDGIREIL